MVGAAVLGFACPASGQSEDWNARLKNKPLYLRGFWAGDKLSFDAAGKPPENSAVGPVCLSGVEVESVALEHKLLVIHAHRVALVAKADGSTGLERRDIASTTHIAFSLRRGDKSNYHAREEMQISVQPDAARNFEPALSAIFASGLPELAAAVPLYWRCYATSYFLPPEISADAERQVARCVVTPAAENLQAGANGRGGMTGPVLLSSGQPTMPEVAAELGARGTVEVHLRIGADGVPVGLQIVRALGAGVDEAVLQAVSQDRFTPATRGGVAVPVDMTIRVQVGSGPEGGSSAK
jgi:TonB family protein